MISDRLAQRLETELGADAITTDPRILKSHEVDGKRGRIFCAPGTTEGVIAALRICAETRAAVTPWGGGTAMSIGNPPEKAEVVLSLDRLNRVIEHDSANLTVTVEAGATINGLNRCVNRERQFLAIEPPRPAVATIGGTIAANLNGPRRSAYGTVRDLVIGIKAALVTGEHVKAGGKVVKNVAGYDMCKLFVGSLGTLGVITEATLRVSPIPESAATKTATGPLPDLLQAADAVVQSQLSPTSIFLVGKRETGNTPELQWELAVASEGFDGTVARHLRDFQSFAESDRLQMGTLRESDHDLYWEQVREFPLKPGASVYRIVVPRAGIGRIANLCEPRANEILVDALSGVLWIRELEAPQQRGFSELGELARDHKGHAMLFTAPAECKGGLDVWGPAPESLFLMRRIKRQFDPYELLNPGRFAGGL